MVCYWFYLASISVTCHGRSGLLCVARYWQLDVNKVPMPNEKEVWDRSVYEASEEYKGRMVGCMTGLMLCCCI